MSFYILITERNNDTDCSDVYHAVDNNDVLLEFDDPHDAEIWAQANIDTEGNVSVTVLEN
jgi:hypothetical protein